jgi:hypothetical protein
LKRFGLEKTVTLNLSPVYETLNAGKPY